MSKNLSEGENAVLGAVGGFLDVTLLQATNYWKNASQQGLPFETNPRVLYRGYSANCLNNATCVMLQFTGTGFIQKLLVGKEDRALTKGEQMVAAFSSGYLSGFVCGPIELAMIQQQRKGTSLPTTTKNLIAGGPSVITRGTFGLCMREALYCSGILGVTPILRASIQENFPDSIGQTEDSARVAAACIGGPIISLMSHPFDTFKSCMQGDIEREKYKSMRQTSAVLIKERGILSLWAGSPWRIFRQLCAMMILDKCASQLSRLLFPHRYPTTA